jgi:L-methionine (R)-S-oxide reductase
MTSALLRLHDLAGFLESEGTLEDNLRRLAETAAAMMETERCSIMLLSAGDAETPRLKLMACVGDMPQAAWQELPAIGEGIAGEVVRRGEALFLEDIRDSEFSDRALGKSGGGVSSKQGPREAGMRTAANRRRAPDDVDAKADAGGGGGSMIAAPIWVKNRVIGVINLNARQDGRPFDGEDLQLLEVIALFAGRTIQVVQLQNLMQSRFAQIALAESAAKSAVLQGNVQPEQVAKIVAKTFYKEMTRAGFSPNQIIQTATEIISELTDSLGKHKRRRGVA